MSDLPPVVQRVAHEVARRRLMETRSMCGGGPFLDEATEVVPRSIYLPQTHPTTPEGRRQIWALKSHTELTKIKSFYKNRKHPSERNRKNSILSKLHVAGISTSRPSSATSSIRPCSEGAYTSRDQFSVISELYRGNHGVVQLVRDKHRRRNLVLKQKICPELKRNQFFSSPTVTDYTERITGKYKVSNRDKISERNLAPSSSEQPFKEYDLLKQLDHPNIIKCHGYFWDEALSSLFIILDYADKGDMHSEFAKRRRASNRHFSDKQVWDIFLQIICGVEKLHSIGIVHRDLKPLNLLLTSSGHVKIGDLGVGKQLSDKTLLLNSFCGTPLYLSPEIVNGRSYSQFTDIWSLGVILYELVTLETPFTGDSLYEVTEKIRNCKYKAIKNRDHNFSELLKWMLQPSPRERPSASELKDIVTRMSKQRVVVEKKLTEKLSPQFFPIEKYPPKSSEKYPPKSPEKYPPKSSEKYPPKSPEKYPPKGPEKYPPKGPEKYPPKGPEKYPPKSPEKYLPKRDVPVTNVIRVKKADDETPPYAVIKLQEHYLSETHEEYQSPTSRLSQQAPPSETQSSLFVPAAGKKSRMTNPKISTSISETDVESVSEQDPQTLPPAGISLSRDASRELTTTMSSILSTSTGGYVKVVRVGKHKENKHDSNINMKNESGTKDHCLRDVSPRDVNPKHSPRDVNTKHSPRDVNPKHSPRDVNPKHSPRDVNPKHSPRDVNPKHSPRDVNPKRKVPEKTPEREKRWSERREKMGKRNMIVDDLDASSIRTSRDDESLKSIPTSSHIVHRPLIPQLQLRKDLNQAIPLPRPSTATSTRSLCSTCKTPSHPDYITTDSNSQHAIATDPHKLSPREFPQALPAGQSTFQPIPHVCATTRRYLEEEASEIRRRLTGKVGKNVTVRKFDIILGRWI